MSKRIDLAVPFKEKDEAKKFQIQWDEENRVWWTTEENMCDGLMRWLPYAPTSDVVVQALPPIQSNEAERQHLKMLSQNCEFREWMLLMLPGGLWGAFWSDDLYTNAASAVVAGDYTNGCRFVSVRPNETIDYMRDNRLYSGALRSNEGEWTESEEEPEQASESDHALSCIGQLTIGGTTIEIQLPWLCENLIKHLVQDTPMPSMHSPLSLEIFAYLDRYTPDHVKYPLTEQLGIAEEISQKLRVPLPRFARENRAACLAFIDANKADLTMYRVIREELAKGSWPLIKCVNNYVKWSTARTMLSSGIPWEAIAEKLGVKTKATIEKYAVQADEAEQDIPELLSSPLYQELIKLGMKGESVDRAVYRLIDDQTWQEFSYERLVRRFLQQQGRTTVDA
jgi:hypothetical protein